MRHLVDHLEERNSYSYPYLIGSQSMSLSEGPITTFESDIEARMQSPSEQGDNTSIDDTPQTTSSMQRKSIELIIKIVIIKVIILLVVLGLNEAHQQCLTYATWALKVILIGTFVIMYKLYDQYQDNILSYKRLISIADTSTISNPLRN